MSSYSGKQRSIISAERNYVGIDAIERDYAAHLGYHLYHTGKRIYRFTGFTGFTGFTDKAISQNVRLLGCVNETCKSCDDCCCSSRLVAPTKIPWKGKKGTTLFVTLQH
jgi:hypothetical protein